jgi:AcrR family transcriptional regulator
MTPPQKAPGRDATRKRAAHLGPERRRPEVLDAALGLFLERGYQGTSMEAIAKVAGVTKPVVYACFPGKDELLRALLAREEERILAEIREAFGGTDLADPETTLVEGYTSFLRAVTASADVYRLVFLGEGGGNMAVARRIRAGREAQIEALSTLIRPWVEQRSGADTLSAADIDNTARLLASTFVGIAESAARLMLSEPDRWSAEDLGARVGRFAAAAQASI